MKTFTTTILILITSCATIAQANNQIVLNPHANAAICNQNPFTGQIIIYPLNGTYPTSFTFSLQPEILNNGSPAIFNTCGNGSAGNWPAQFVLTNFVSQPNCASIAGAATFNSVTHEYIWTVNISQNQCSPQGVIEIVFNYDIYLDCSLIPVILPTPQSVLTMNMQGVMNYNQSQYQSNITGISIAIPYLIDIVSTNNTNGAVVGGNYGQTDNIVYQYLNSGFAAITIDLQFSDKFYCSVSPTYQINTFVVKIVQAGGGSTIIATINGPGAAFNLNGVTIGPQEVLQIEENISILNCTSNINSSCSNKPQKGELKWKCHSAPPTQLPNQTFCNECLNVYQTPFIFTYDNPSFNVELINTTPAGAQMSDRSCFNEEVMWRARVKNISAYSTLPFINLHFENPYYGNNALTIIYPSYLNNPGTSDFHCAGGNCPSSFTAVYNNFNANFQGNTPACYAGSGTNNNSLRSFDFTINEIPAGGYVEFEFKTYKCCGTNTTINQSKWFNQWTVLSTGQAKCGSQISVSSSGNNDLAINILNGISQHSDAGSGNTDDLNLLLQFPASSTSDLNVPPKIPPQNYSYGILEKLNQSVFMTGMFGDNADKQALGYHSGSPLIKSILEIKIHCDKGLLIDQLHPQSNFSPIIYNPYEIQLSYQSGIPVPSTYNVQPITYHVLETTSGNYLYPNTSNFTPGLCPGSNCQYYADCEGGDYYFYYDLSLIPSNHIDDFFLNGKFNFTLLPCCTAAEGNSNYSITFNLLLNHQGNAGTACNTFVLPAIPGDAPSCNGCCWMPMSEVHGFINVHCPGCRAPGVIVDFYQMRRNSFGLKDEADDRLADIPLSLIDAAYLNTHYPELNTISSVHGDMVVDTIVSHFQPGDPTIIDPNSNAPDFFRGYTYNSPNAYSAAGDMRPDQSSPPNNINLNVLQIYKKITWGGCDKMNLQIQSVDIYVDEGSGNINTCMECNSNWKTDFKDRTTLFKYSVTNPTANLHHLEIRSNGPDKELMITLRVGDIINGSTPNGTITNYSGTLSQFKFREGQQYRVYVHYKVLGNTYSSYWSPVVADELHLQSTILNWIWLTGGVTNPDGFTLDPSITNLYFDYRPQMPNLIYNALDATDTKTLERSQNNPLYFNYNSVSSVPYCQGANCIPADQQNLGDYYRFFCEPRSGFHHFYSTDTIISTGYWANSFSTGSCERKINTTVLTSYGQGRCVSHTGSTTGGNTHYNLFPYEFKTPSLMPYNPTSPNFSFVFDNIPTGYSISPNHQAEVQSVVFDKAAGASLSNWLNFSPSITGNAIKFNQNNMGALNILSQFPASPSVLTTGDERLQQTFNIYLMPTCSLATVTPTFTKNDAVMYCGETANSAASPINVQAQAPYICNGTSHGGEAANNYWVLKFATFNPNLNMVLTPPQFDVTNHQVCWHFTMSNFNIPATPAISGAPNVFVQVPASNPAFSNWQLTFDYGSLTNYSAPMPVTGFFQLFPVPNSPPNPNQPFLYSLFPAAGNLLTGTICADYNQCLGSATIPFDYGWNCTNNFSGPLCSSNTLPSAINDVKPNLQVLQGSQRVNTVIPPNATIALCDQAINTMQVDFKNLTTGEAVAKQIRFGNLQGSNSINIISVTIKDCNGINADVMLLPPLIPNTDPWIIPQGTWLDHIAISQAAGISSCLRVLIEFQPLCQFGTQFVLPDITLDYYSFCESAPAPFHTITAEFTPVPIAESHCTDCFQITKTANVTQAVNGLETVSFTIEICSNNDPGISGAWNTYPVQVFEGIPGQPAGFPTGFSASLDPFGNNGTLPLNYSFQYTSSANPICAVIVYPAGNPLEGIFTGSPGSQACNDAYLLNPATGSAFTSSACITLLPGCENIFPNAIILPPGTQLSNISLSQPEYIVQGTLLADAPLNTISNKIFHMEQGSEIVVPAGKTLDIRQSSLYGCSKMWKGITLSGPASGQAGAVLSISRGSELNDAYYGAYAPNGTTVGFYQSYFGNNYVSLYIPPVPSSAAKMNKTAADVYYSTFYGTGAMLPMYQCAACLPVSSKVPKAGIEVNDVSVSIHSCCGINHFENLSNGIIGYRSNLYLNNNRFFSIHADAAYNNQTLTTTGLTSFNGSAIYGTGTTTSGSRAVKIDQTGFGNQPGTSLVTMDDCDYGVYDDNIELISRDNIILNIGKAAYHSQLATRQTRIENNYIESLNTGIELFAYDNAFITRIQDNEISFGDPAGGGVFSYSIRAEGTNAAVSDLHHIYRNIINFRSHSLNSFRGIYSNSNTRLVIIDNILNMWNNDVNQDGIYSSNGVGNITNCNHIRGDGINFKLQSSQSAIADFMSAEPEIGCNDMDGTNNGIYVLGPITVNMTPFTEIKGNDFYRHTYSFRFGQNALVTAPLNYRGNKWNAASTLTGGFQAWNQGSFTPYKVNSLIMPLLPLSQFPPSWFFFFGGTQDFSCYTPENYCQNHIPPQLSNTVKDMDRMIAADTLQNNPYTDETRWMLKKGLSKKIDDNPAMLSDTLMNQFYTTYQNSTLAELNPIEEAKAALFVTDSIIDTLYQQNHAMIAQQLSDEHLQMDLLDIAITYNDTALLAVIINTLDLKEQAIVDKAEQSDSLAALTNGNRNIAADIVNNTNAALSIGNMIEYNERTVNEIYLTTIAKGIYTFTPLQIQQLHDIAIQCPMAGGNAVFRGRAMYALIERTLFYDDFVLCSQAGITLRQANQALENKSDVQHIATLNPNPANEKATLEYDIPETETGVFSLSNSTGQSVFSLIITGGKRAYTFSTKALAPGVYHYVLVSNGKCVDNGKVVIIR